MIHGGAEQLHTVMWGGLRGFLGLKTEDKRELPNVIAAQFQYFTKLSEAQRRWKQLDGEALEAKYKRVQEMEMEEEQRRRTEGERKDGDAAQVFQRRRV